MMATYSRIIKENERLHNALQKARNESTKHIDDKLLRILELKLNGCVEQLEALRKLIPLYEQKIFDGQQKASESELKQKEADVYTLRVTFRINLKKQSENCTRRWHVLKPSKRIGTC